MQRPTWLLSLLADLQCLAACIGGEVTHLLQKSVAPICSRPNARAPVDLVKRSWANRGSLAQRFT
jgi:hypothetical protein